MSELRRSWNRKPAGTSRTPKTAEPLLPENRANSYSASGGSAVLREYVVAASTVPGVPRRLATSSASLGRFQEDAGQSATSASAPPSPITTSIPAAPASLSVYQPHPLYGRNHTTHSSGNLSSRSSQSRASERLSTTANSRESLHIPVDKPSPPRGVYRQFGPGVDPSTSTSRGQLSRSPSPSYRHNITRSDSRLAITTTYVHPHPHDADEGRSPVAYPSSSSSMHGPLRPLSNHNMSGSSTSINLSIHGPSTDSLPTALMEHSPIASSATSQSSLPEPRYLKTIRSNEIRRYDDNVTM